MRIAVLSDIHGFNLALETVLADIDEHGPFDEVVVAGDLCELGPAPREVLELLWERDFTVVQGNTDLELVEGAKAGTDDPELRYGIEQVGETGLAYLEELPLSYRVTPPGAIGQAGDLLVVHANPSNLHDSLLSDLSEDEIRTILGDTVAAAIAFGHVHVSYIRKVDDVLLVDVSAVGNPKDGDLRSRYGVLTWDAAVKQWTAEIRKVPYPLEETEAQIRRSGVPKPEKTIRKLRRASYKD